jgi:SAM-dependent methyltransferase
VPDSVTGFYDGLADEYHLLFADWDASVRRQGGILERLIAEQIGDGPKQVLDCSCGIGTQAIGLALRGHRVHGTDLSPAAVARAEREAARLGASLTTDVADLRALDAVPGRYDVVLSCDNAVPHLLTDADLSLAAAGMYAKLRPDGLLVVSIRDYDALLAERPRAERVHAELPRVFDRPDGRQIAFQVWDWDADAPIYTVHQYIVREQPAGAAREQSDGTPREPAAGPGQASRWQTHHEATTYRAIQRAELSEIVEQAGFRDVAWRLPDETGYYQPILTART